VMERKGELAEPEPRSLPRRAFTWRVTARGWGWNWTI